MPPKDYYDALGVPRDASPDAIRKAYRRLAKKHHPDATATADDQAFKEITEAYDVLSDPDKKAAYDARGRLGGAFQFSYSNVFGGGFGTFFSEGQSQGFRSPSRRFSANQRLMIEIGMDQAYVGGVVSFDVQRLKECSDCGGKGMASPTGEACQYCGGSGRMLAGLAVCGSCGGTGKKGVFCGSCGGTGGIEETAKAEMRIPPRIMSGSSMVVKGQGNLLAGGERGDLRVTVTYASPCEDVELMPDGSLLKQVRMPWESALMGRTFSFRLFKVCPSDETITLDCTRPNGWVYVVGGKGMRVKSDLLVKVWYDLPTNITVEDRLAIARAITDAKSRGLPGPDSDSEGHL